MTNSKLKDSKISEGVIIALSSACAYLFSFYYEKGYASVFKIPTQFISVNLTSILTYGTILIAVMMFVMPMVNLLLMLSLGRIRPVVQRTIIPVILIFALLAIQVFIFGFSNWQYWYQILILFFCFYVFPIHISANNSTRWNLP